MKLIQDVKHASDEVDRAHATREEGNFRHQCIDDSCSHFYVTAVQPDVEIYVAFAVLDRNGS